MINDLNEFHLCLGEMIMFCQTAESDIKWICSAMKAGDMAENRYSMDEKKKTLGKAIRELKNLDRSDDNHFFSDDEFDILEDMKDIRNYWVHEGYLHFVYSSDERCFAEQAKLLEEDHNRLKRLSESIEDAKLDVMHLYGMMD